MQAASLTASPGPWEPVTTTGTPGHFSKYASAASSRTCRLRDGTVPLTPAPRTMTAWGSVSQSVRDQAMT